MKYLKAVLLFLLCLINVINSKGQVTDFKIFNLKGFGIVTVPTILDTIGQRINKAIIAERIDEIQESKIADINTQYHVNLNKTLLDNTLEGTFRFWNSKTLNYFIDTALAVISSNRDLNEIDYSKIELIPNISLKKDPTPVSSDYVLNHVFLNKDSANAFLKIVENMLRTLKSTLSDSKVISVSSSYSLIESKYPLVKGSCIYSSFDNTEYVQTFYFLFKQYHRYSLKFEYRKKDSLKWSQYMDKFFSEMKLF